MAISYSTIAPKNGNVVIDRTRCADPINYTFRIRIQNQGTTTMYYKITTSDPNWSITSPTNGELGSVASGSTVTKEIQLQRTLPTADTVETLQFTLEAYSDSGYTNLIESTNFSIKFVIADIHSFPNYTNYNFDDGTWQGWTVSYENASSPKALAKLTTEKSIGAGGYSIKLTRTEAGGYVKADYVFSKTEEIPNNSTCVLVFYMNRTSNNPPIYYIKVRVNGETIFHVDSPNIGTTTWDIIGVDLSDYAGQTVTLEIVVRAYVYIYQSTYKEHYLDEIIIAGTDAL